MAPPIKSTSFWARWWVAWIYAVDSGLTRVSGIVTLLTGFGLAFTEIISWWVPIAMMVALLLIVAAWVKPSNLAPPNISERIALNVVNEFLADATKVALLGSYGTGKTTFLDATVSRVNEGKKTDKAYGQLVLVPDINPEKYIILLDTVGGVSKIQFAIQDQSSVVLFFVDHNESSSDSQVDENRLASHSALAEQLIHSCEEDGKIIDRLCILVGKSDLWQSACGAEERMQIYGAELKAMFDNSASYREVMVTFPFSNNSQYDVAKAIRAAGDDV